MERISCANDATSVGVLLFLMRTWAVIESRKEKLGSCWSGAFAGPEASGTWAALAGVGGTCQASLLTRSQTGLAFLAPATPCFDFTRPSVGTHCCVHSSNKRQLFSTMSSSMAGRMNHPDGGRCMFCHAHATVSPASASASDLAAFGRGQQPCLESDLLCDRCLCGRIMPRMPQNAVCRAHPAAELPQILTPPGLCPSTRSSSIVRPEKLPDNCQLVASTASTVWSLLKFS